MTICRIFANSTQKLYLCKTMEQEKLNWYGLKIFFNKVFEWEAELGERGLETYIPVRLVKLEGEEHLRVARRLAVPGGGSADSRYVQEGAVLYRREPVVSSLLFVHAPESAVPEIDSLLLGQGFVYRMADRKRPSVIPDKEMAVFRMVCSSGADGLEFFCDEDMTRYRKGDRVRVLDGPLKGAEGYVRRIRKDRRLLVCIEGFIAVATSYIPPQLLEKVKEDDAPAENNS